jgi:hypothetical protein
MAEVDVVDVCDNQPNRLADALATSGVPGYSDHLTLRDAIRPDRIEDGDAVVVDYGEQRPVPFITA